MTVDKGTDVRGFDAPVQEPRRDLVTAGRVVADWVAARRSLDDLVVRSVTMPKGTGVANETLIMDAEWVEAGERRRGGFVVRVAPSDPLFRDADIEVHDRMYAALADEPGVPVPEVYGYEPDPSLLGEPFFVMEKIDGDVPADQPYYTEQGFVADASVGQRQRLWRDAVECSPASTASRPASSRSCNDPNGVRPASSRIARTGGRITTGLRPGVPIRSSIPRPSGLPATCPTTVPPRSRGVTRGSAT